MKLGAIMAISKDECADYPPCPAWASTKLAPNGHQAGNNRYVTSVTSAVMICFSMSMVSTGLGGSMRYSPIKEQLLELHESYWQRQEEGQKAGSGA